MKKTESWPSYSALYASIYEIANSRQIMFPIITRLFETSANIVDSFWRIRGYWFK